LRGAHLRSLARSREAMMKRRRNLDEIYAIKTV
jgi:hypothetical protein